jgi:hypothetical protein
VGRQIGGWGGLSGLGGFLEVETCSVVFLWNIFVEGGPWRYFACTEINYAAEID